MSKVIHRVGTVLALVAVCIVSVACAGVAYRWELNAARERMTESEATKAEEVRLALKRSSDEPLLQAAVTVDGANATVWLKKGVEPPYHAPEVAAVIEWDIMDGLLGWLRTLTLKDGSTNPPVTVRLRSFPRPGDRYALGDDLVLMVPTGWSGWGPLYAGEPLQMAAGESLSLSPNDIDYDANVPADEVNVEVVRSRAELRESLAWRATGPDEDDGPAVADSEPWVTFDWQGRKIEARAGGPTPTRPSWRLGVDVVIPVEPQGFVLVRAGTDQARWGAAGAGEPQEAAEDILRRFGFANAE